MRAPKNDWTPIAGLPPARSRLLRHLAARAAIDEQLADARDSRAALAGDVADTGEAEKALRSRVAADAANVLSQVRRKAKHALAAISGAARGDLEAKEAEARHRREVGTAALNQLDAEIADIERQAAELVGQTDATLADALLEHARLTVGETYTTMLVELRALMARLEGVERVAGGGRFGRLVAEVPKFGIAGILSGTIAVSAGDSDIANAASAWRALGAAWLEDPKADPATVLKFPKLCVSPTAGVAYSDLHPVERREVDVAFAQL